MSKTPADISAAIRATLALTIPGLSCEIGTPERKIIDAVSEAVSEAYIDQYLVGSLLDIDTKSGLELEQFVGIFGFGRLAGKRAQGTMRVTVNTVSTQDQTFPAGTQFYTQPGIAGLSKTIYFSSKQAVVLVAGNTACDIPVEAQDPGSQANLPPDSITYVGNMIGGSSCTNLTAMTGGVDQETDPELRQRFKDTLLRNVAGTHDFYEALCQQNDSVSRVVVFGPVRLYSTQIEVPDTNLTLPVNQDVKYAWPGQVSVFTNLGQEDETFYSPVDDYTFIGGTSPSITRLSDNLTVGDVVDLEFQYTTKSSRNDPVNGITNKVDIFVDGISPYSIREACVIPSAALSADSLDPLYTGNFRRVGSAGDPTEGNRFMRLGSTPLVSFPSQLTVNGVVYSRGTHYHVLQDTTLIAGTHQETSGVEWTVAGPPTDTELTVDYVYNRTPELLNAVMARAKQVTTDVLVHQGEFVYIQPCLTVEYDRAYSVSVVNSGIVNRLQTFFSMMPFGSQVKLGTLCMFVQQVLGVVDVKVTTADDDPVDYGVQIFANSLDTVPMVVQTTDFKLDDNQLANYQGVKIRRVATP